MKLKEDLSLAARGLYGVFGVTLATATIVSAWHDWPLVLSHKTSPVLFGLMIVIALPLSALIVVWACIGRHREWHIGEQQIRIRVLSLTSWRKVAHISPDAIEDIAVENAAYDDTERHTAYWLRLKLKGGRTLSSPKTFDKAAAEQAKAEIDRLRATMEAALIFQESGD